MPDFHAFNTWVIILQYFGILRFNMYQVALAIFNIIVKNNRANITFRDDLVPQSYFLEKESFSNTIWHGTYYIKQIFKIIKFYNFKLILIIGSISEGKILFLPTERLSLKGPWLSLCILFFLASIWKYWITW